MINPRIGFGLDFHRLENNRDFWLGGIIIPHEKGAVGHSDADTLIHAICDAMLGAAGLGDIGMHFPDSSEEFKGIDSKVLLRKVLQLIHNNNLLINNIDSTVVLQRPKIASYIPKMKEVLSQTLSIPESAISIKATTTEKLGFVGREEGISAYAIVLLHKTDHEI